MRISHRKPRRHSTIGEPSAQDLDGWEFGLPEETTAPEANTPIEAARTDSVEGKRSESEFAGWTFGTTDDHRDRPAVITGPTDPIGSADILETGSGVSSLEARLAPIVGALVVLSLLLGGGYLFVVTIW